MHGDFHLANVLFAPDRPAVAAVVDWEMCTVGDPLLDLGWMLATWPGTGGVSQVGEGQLVGLPTADALVDRYASQSGRELTDVRWYDVLARFKLGIVLEGTHARACAGKAGRDVGDLLHATATSLLGSAHDLVAAG